MLPAIAHADTIVYLDGDAATTTIVQLKPGDYAKINMPYDVTFSSVHGDDENKDSEVIVGNIDIKVGLGDDAVILTIKDGGQQVYSEELARQNGFVWSQNEKGAATIELILDCNGNLKIYVNDKEAYTANGYSTTTSLDVLGDKDASLSSHGEYYACGTTTLPDYKVGVTVGSHRMYYAAAAIAVAIVAGAVALAFRG